MRRGLYGLVLALMLSANARAESPPLIAVVVAASSTAEPQNAASLSLIFKRKKQLWRDGSRILPVNLPANHPLRERFSREVLGMTPEALEDYWNEQYFHGVAPPHVLASEAAVSRFVAETPGAIGYVRLCGMDSRLRAVLMMDAEGRLQAPLQGTASCTAVGAGG